MTHIDLHLATKLDGSETHMIAILVDSWGDKLVVPLNCETHSFAADYFTPCAHCGNAVLDCNFDGGSDCCDRCTYGHKSDFKPYLKHQLPNGSCIVDKNAEDCAVYIKSGVGKGLSKQDTDKLLLINTLPEDLMEVKEALVRQEAKLKEDVMTMEDRIKAARQEAEDTFWAVVVKHFPEAVDGSFLMSDMDEIMLSWVQHWVENNVPAATAVEPSWRGDLGKLSELNLHYEDTWHLWHSGGGCMIASTDNVAVNGEYHFLCISMDCVCIYKDTFVSEEFMMDALCCWSYGENPTVMMNQIDEFLGGPTLWDTGKLFDDIMTIAKSKHM